MAESDEVPSIKVVRTSSTDETKGILKKRGRIMTPEERYPLSRARLNSIVCGDLYRVPSPFPEPRESRLAYSGMK